MNHTPLLLAGLLVFAIALPATAADKAAPDPTVTAAIEAAEAANKKAASVGGEWRDTGKMIKGARTAAMEGDNAKAGKLAATARFQAESGYEQAMSQKKMGTPSYLK